MMAGANAAALNGISEKGSRQTAAPAVSIIQAGDVNGNGNVSIADVVAMVNYIIGIQTDGVSVENADVNKNKIVTVSDLTSTVDIILSHSVSGKGNLYDGTVTMSEDRLTVGNFNGSDGNFNIGVCLDNTMAYTSLQASVKLPEGMEVASLTKGPRVKNHQLMYNVTDDGILHVILFSFANSVFRPGNEPLFTISGTASADSGELVFENIIAADSDNRDYKLGYTGGLNESKTSGLGVFDGTGITIRVLTDGIEVEGAAGESINVFTAAGERIAAVANASDYEKINLQGGIYVVTAGDRSAKVRVK